MQDYSTADGFWAQRVRKEVWSNSHLRNFLTETGTEQMKKKFQLTNPKGQTEAKNPALSTIREKLEHVRTIKNN